MPNPINQELLWQAIVWVQWHYSQQPHTKQCDRPQRPYQRDDGKHLATLIEKTNHAYRTKKQAGEPADFNTSKGDALKTGSLDTPTRNFYSSVISTYTAWNRSGIPSAAMALLPTLVPFVTYLQRR